MTTVPEVLPHVAAVRAALQQGGITTYLAGAKPGPADPPKTYAVLYPAPGTVEAASMADDRTVLDVMVQVTCVGSTPEGAIGTADRAARALAPALEVDGRACWRASVLGGPPVQRDDDLVPPAWALPVQYRIKSIPA